MRAHLEKANSGTSCWTTSHTKMRTRHPSFGPKDLRNFSANIEATKQYQDAHPRKPRKPRRKAGAGRKHITIKN